ncbi:MAG: sialate O-acetylesterase [Prevotella sp.]|nr:sialate O-acetylesterase [Prevotellaceae bacterium]MDY5344276.1 sialate O-acetylesterase [Prevotella sp.]
MKWNIKWAWMFSMEIMALVGLTACDNCGKPKVVVCVPVYGQSLAMGEEAELVTDIDGLSKKWEGRLVGEGLDDGFGYYEDRSWKKKIKRLIRYDNRRNENSAFAMGEALAGALGKDTIVCVFADGRGGTAISNLIKGSYPYEALIQDIQKSYDEARNKGMEFIVPAVCWMQGESDMFDYTRVDYRKLLRQFAADVNKDVKSITGQKRDVKIVGYQSCCLAKCYKFVPENYECYEISVPQAQMQLIRDDSCFVAGTPVYFLDFVDDRIHLDGKSQTVVGRYNAAAVLDILRYGYSDRGLYPVDIKIEGKIAIIDFNKNDSKEWVGNSGKLEFDTINVNKVKNYGFSVITPENKDIAEKVTIVDDKIVIECNADAKGCRVRYGANGEKNKSGRRLGARGNLLRRNSSMMPEWCYMFDEATNER